MYRTICKQLVVLREIYGQLLQLASEKESVLKANKDLKAIQGYTESEAILVAQAIQAERIRMEAVEQIAEKLGVGPDSLTISMLAKHATPLMGEALLNEADILTELLRRLQTQNDRNRQLLEMNLSFAAFMLDTMAREEKLGSIYCASGIEADNATQESRFLDNEI